MSPTRVLARMALLGVTVPVCTALLYALWVPVFLGREESSREGVLRTTAAVTGVFVAALAAWLLRMNRAVLVACAAVARRTTVDEAPCARLHAAPREMAALCALAAAGIFSAGLVSHLASPDRASLVSCVVAAAFALTASLVSYPSMRRALRPLFERLPSPTAAPPLAWGDRLAVRVALAVAIPSGVAALLAALLVGAHTASTAHAQDELNARVFSLALGVRRLPGETESGRAAAARVLDAAGARVVPGVSLPTVEAGPVDVHSPALPLLGALVFVGVGVALGLRIGRRATLELGRARRRVETVGLQQLASSGRGSVDGMTFTLSFGAVSLPEVRAISKSLDRLTETLSKMARDQRRALNARAETARLRSFVLAGVSHDLRGPLNSVLGFAGLLLTGVDGEVNAAQRESLEALHRGGRDLLRLVDDLLDAARIDAGRLSLAPVRVTVEALLNAARTAAFERAAGAVADETRVPIEGEVDVEACVDRERMAHHLGAMIAYAMLRKGAAPSHGSSPVVTLRARAVDGDRWSVVITGAGTAPTREVLAQLFAPFDLPPSGARAPAGLGLALGVARRVIEQHGGEVVADVAPEGGLAMRVTLPRAKAVAKAAGRVASVPPRGGAR